MYRGAKTTSFSSDNTALRISSEALSGLTPVAVAGSVTVSNQIFKIISESICLADIPP